MPSFSHLNDQPPCKYLMSGSLTMLHQALARSMATGSVELLVQLVRTPEEPGGNE